MTLDTPKFITRLRAGDELAVEELSRVLLVRLTRIYLRYGLDDMESRSLANWTIAVALQQIATFQSKATLATWICGIAHNTGTRLLRDRFRYDEPRDVLDHPQLVSLDDPAVNTIHVVPHPPSSEGTRATGRSRRHLLARRAWVELDKSGRRALLEIKCLGLTAEEIARRDRVCLSAVWKRAYRAQRRLDVIYQAVAADA
jgi:DNA-directed RNA polymerase specialized sigma24 family protein